MVTRTRSDLSVKSRNQELVRVFAPLVEFFHRAGFPPEEIYKAIDISIRRAGKAKASFVVRRVGDVDLYGAIVRKWNTAQAFAGPTGRPAQLPLTGTRSFVALARATGYLGPIGKLLKLMISHGSVRRLRNGKVELQARYMNYRLSRVMTYEWQHNFLCDAIAAATRGMGGVGGNKKLFSYVNVARGVSATHVNQFLSDGRQRNAAFADELSPWLEYVANSATRSRKRAASYRLGLGVFPICSLER